MAADGETAVNELLAAVAESERGLCVFMIRACYETACQVSGGEFAKAWVRGLRGVPMNLKKLERHGILALVGSTRHNHRAYWQMVDRDGVGRALEALRSV